MLEHFKKDNFRKFADKKVEFSCKKGAKNDVNQDNFFVITENKTKFMGVFDGHGINGHKASAFTMGAMVDYIQNSKRFNEAEFEKMSDEDMEKAIRKCFRYAQDMA